LATLVLLREELLPLVIDRDLRVEYLTALEVADQASDLSPLASLFARLERAAILEALSVDLDAEVEREQSLSSAVIQSLAAKFNARRAEKHAELRRVNSLAERLRARTRRGVERTLNELRRSIEFHADAKINVADGGPDQGNSHWYKFEVTKTGHRPGTYVNFNEAHYFTKASIRAGRERLVFVVSLHHVGRELSGIMEATAFARLESFEESDDREHATQEFFVCALEPFVFTHKTAEGEIADTFDRWLDSALAVAIKDYGDRL
jgi:hypothetical protein